MTHLRSILSGLLIAIVALAIGAPEVAAARRTVCTITVNSPDERNAFRRYLPESQYEFVELVERGRPDWLESACRKGVQCDVLVVSGHFNGHDFFSDQLKVDEFLPVEEMERTSCSDSCPGLFAKLKEVYLFGCTTLQPEAAITTADEIARNLARTGRPPAEAQRLAASLQARYGESNRDVMRRIFENVPVIYGFSSVAPLGPTAGPLLQRYFASAGPGAVGSGQPNRKLLSQFAAHNMAVTTGVRAGGDEARYRDEVCRLVDQRPGVAAKVAFVHDLLQRDMGQVRVFLDRIERFMATVPAGERADAATRRALAGIAQDQGARERFLAYARASDRAEVRARMLEMAHRLAWLTDGGLRTELVALVHDLLAQPVIPIADIGVACDVDERHHLGPDSLPALQPAALRTSHAAVRACLGDSTAHARTVAALASGELADVDAVEMYLQHRPLDDTDELRSVIAAIGAMRNAAAQARAFDVLARHRIADADALQDLVDLFPAAHTIAVQRAIAGVLIRSDFRAIAAPEAVAVLRAHRLPSHDGADMVDILIRRLAGSAAEERAAMNTGSRG